MIELDNLLNKQMGQGEYPSHLFDFFNWGAFALPEVWGIFHGVWSIVIMAVIATIIPMFILTSIAMGETMSNSAYYGVLVISQVTQGVVRLWAGMNANRLFWRQAASNKSSRLGFMRRAQTIKQYFAKQKQWALVGMIVMIISTVIGSWWNFTSMGEMTNATEAAFTLAQDFAWLTAFLLGAYYIARQAAILMAPSRGFNYLTNMKKISVDGKVIDENQTITALNDVISTGVFTNDTISTDSIWGKTTEMTDTNGSSGGAGSHDQADDEVFAYPLANGQVLPVLGLGTYKMAAGAETVKSVMHALDAGYRSFDTASFYGNESSIGEALKSYGIPRDEVFLTSKVWNDQQGYVNTIRAFEDSLLALETDYLDMYLVHWPIESTLRSTWRALEHLYAAGSVRAIGVCNFGIEHLEHLLAHAHVAPMVDQIELHPRFTRQELVLYCWNHDMLIQTWAPLMRGKVAQIAEIEAIAQAHDRTAAQVALRWAVQHNFAVIPKSITPARIVENAQIFDFELTPAEMELIDSLDRDDRLGPDPHQFSWHQNA